MVYVLKERHAEDAHVVLTDLRSKRACADPNLGFQAQLQVWCDLRFDLVVDFGCQILVRIDGVGELIQHSAQVL